MWNKESTPKPPLEPAPSGSEALQTQQGGIVPTVSAASEDLPQDPKHERLFSLVLKILESTISVIVMFLHSGELHVLNSLSTSGIGMIYSSAPSLMPVYLVARASSAVWDRPWIVPCLDAIMNVYGALVYLLAAVALSWSIESIGQLFEAHIEHVRIPPQRTKLNQQAAWCRFILAILLAALLLFEASATIFYWPQKFLFDLFKPGKTGKTRK